MSDQIAERTTEHRNYLDADEVREFPHGRLELLNIGGGEVGRLTLQPGWRWSNDVKPMAGTELCEAPHFSYQVSGRLGWVMDDGTEFETVGGEVAYVESGHDAWVVGEDPVVAIDWNGATHYAEGAPAGPSRSS
jgi:hypothetical protein